MRGHDTSPMATGWTEMQKGYSHGGTQRGPMNHDGDTRATHRTKGTPRGGTPRETGPNSSHAHATHHEAHQGAERIVPVEPRGKAHRPRRHGGRATVIAIAAVVALAAGGAWMWHNRSVQVTLDGETYQTKNGSTLEQIIEQKGLSPKAGNLVSINGNVIKQGEGSAFSAKVNGSDLSQDQISSYHAKSGDSIQVSDGADKVEDSTTTSEDAEPKLTMKGDYGAVAYVSQWGKMGKKNVTTGKVSGETKETVTQEPQDVVITLHNVKPDNGKKLVALTFDDGPSTYTEQYLKILAQYNAKATFFNLGSQIREYPKLSKAIVDAGCQVASHTDKHQELPALDAESLQQEFTNTFKSIKDADGVDTTIFRPPYGEFKESTWLKSGGLVSASIIWNLDSEDWRRPGVDAIVSNCTTGVTSGDIILMHDGGGNRDQDVEALPKILQTLTDQGYTFVTMNELMASDSSIPSDIASGNATMPEGSVWPTQMEE